MGKMPFRTHREVDITTLDRIPRKRLAHQVVALTNLFFEARYLQLLVPPSACMPKLLFLEQLGAAIISVLLEWA